jgi:hypothetical protein
VRFDEKHPQHLTHVMIRRPREVVPHFARRLDVRPGDTAPLEERERYAAMMLAIFSPYVQHDDDLVPVSPDVSTPFISGQLWSRFQQWEMPLDSSSTVIQRAMQRVQRNYALCASAEQDASHRVHIRAELLLTTEALAADTTIHTDDGTVDDALVPDLDDPGSLTHPLFDGEDGGEAVGTSDDDDDVDKAAPSLVAAPRAISAVDILQATVLRGKTAQYVAHAVNTIATAAPSVVHPRVRSPDISAIVQSTSYGEHAQLVDAIRLQRRVLVDLGNDPHVNDDDSTASPRFLTLERIGDHLQASHTSSRIAKWILRYCHVHCLSHGMHIAPTCSRHVDRRACPSSLRKPSRASRKTSSSVRGNYLRLCRRA